MATRITTRTFEPTGILAQCNDFERAICKTVFQEKYSSNVKTYHVVDHLLNRGEELGLTKVSRFNDAIAVLRTFSSYHAGLIKGFVGERKAFYAVKHALDEGEQLVNVELGFEGEHSEYDQILVTEHGLIVIEVKNYASDSIIGKDGVLRFSEKDSHACSIAERMSSKRYVLSQIAAQAIGRSLSGQEITCVIVNSSNKGRMKSLFGGIEVLTTGNIGRFISSHMETTTHFTPQEVSAILQSIQTKHHPLDAVPDISFDYISDALHEALTMIEHEAQKNESAEGGMKIHQRSDAESDPEADSGKRWATPSIIGPCLASLLLGLASGLALGRNR